ncbi:MAG: hypothetical protein JWQ09_5206, partial [Segetibacter sp.]|nr:hypothetical protein [Segetibacter sp.]
MKHYQPFDPATPALDFLILRRFLWKKKIILLIAFLL